MDAILVALFFQSIIIQRYFISTRFWSEALKNSFHYQMSEVGDEAQKMHGLEQRAQANNHCHHKPHQFLQSCLYFHHTFSCGISIWMSFLTKVPKVMSLLSLHIWQKIFFYFKKKEKKTLERLGPFCTLHCKELHPN